MGQLISNLGTCRIGCEVGLDFYERAKRASNDHNFQAIHIPSIALHIFPVITLFCQRFRTTCSTVLCGNITIYVKLLINYKHLSVGNRINTSGSSAGANISVSPWAKPMDCDTPFRVPRSPCSLEYYSLT